MPIVRVPSEYKYRGYFWGKLGRRERNLSSVLLLLFFPPFSPSLAARYSVYIHRRGIPNQGGRTRPVIAKAQADASLLITTTTPSPLSCRYTTPQPFSHTRPSPARTVTVIPAASWARLACVADNCRLDLQTQAWPKPPRRRLTD